MVTRYYSKVDTALVTKLMCRSLDFPMGNLKLHDRLLCTVPAGAASLPDLVYIGYRLLRCGVWMQNCFVDGDLKDKVLDGTGTRGGAGGTEWAAWCMSSG